ncbi:flavodoxin family protein [Trichloromonas sp.]|uniref:flavodoxin family protein n=1 Tax=Trichloromonas sp. TaxID=3069249 RepID=UPI003D81C283
MNIVCLFGSPRKQGNSATVARHFLQRAEQHGASVRSYYLNDLNYRGCQACDACKTSHERCVLQDDLAPVLEAVFEADLLVMASPVYYTDVSAQLKGFIDRSYSYLLPGYIAMEHPSRLPVRKPLVFILTQGHRDPALFADVLPRYRDVFHWTGFAETHSLRVVDVYRKGDVDSRPDILAEAEQLADRLLMGAG